MNSGRLGLFRICHVASSVSMGSPLYMSWKSVRRDNRGSSGCLSSVLPKGSKKGSSTKTVGGKKLTKISPNKTISGTIGSFIFSIIPIFLYNFYDSSEYPIIIWVVLLSLQISLICQIGDLLISYFKRKAKVKDTGSILPGHGGILDRIDGIVFGLPFGLLLLLIR